MLCLWILFLKASISFGDESDETEKPHFFKAVWEYSIHGETDFLMTLGIWVLLSMSILAMEQRWIDDLNQRFPGIGYEFPGNHSATQHGAGDLSVEVLIEKLTQSGLCTGCHYKRQNLWFTQRIDAIISGFRTISGRFA